jgi:hypothetical protein
MKNRLTGLFALLALVLVLSPASPAAGSAILRFARP